MKHVNAAVRNLVRALASADANDRFAMDPNEIHRLRTSMQCYMH